MSRGSLRIRLLAAAAISIILALFLTGLALVQIFERQVRQRVMEELNNDLLQLAGAIEVTTDGNVRVGRSLADPRFQEPYGGRYWRIDFAAPGEAVTREPLRSRSLWDTDVDPANPKGPEGETVVVARRQLSVQIKGAAVPLWLLVTAHEDEIKRPLGELRDQLVLSLILIGTILFLGAWIQVSVGLKPLEMLRRQLADVRGGRAQKLSGDVPSEVAPLVEEFNDVLAMREQSLERARRRAGDLAHGLKTPLTVLTAIARDVRARKLKAQADEIDEQTETMRRHVEKALARARLSSGRGHATTPLKPLMDKVIAAMERLPKGGDIDWDVHIVPEAAMPIEVGDLTELLGNLLDNARKWTKTRVKIRYAPPIMTIEDDGPGVPEDQVGYISERGRRLDETEQGSGLGLSIVEDIADIYGLAVDYDRSELGGLRVTIRV